MGLLEQFLSLEYQYITSDLVKSEIKSANTKRAMEMLIAKKRIQIVSLNYDELTQAQQIKKMKSALSITDCSVIFLAKKYDAILLSGDKPVRTTAKQLGIEYHGILWALDKLLYHNKITKKQAHDKLNYLMTINSRLPEKECRKRLDIWNTDQY